MELKYLFFVVWLAFVTYKDYREMIIPDKYIAAGVIGYIIFSLNTQLDPLGSLCGTAAGFTVMLMLSLITRGGIGGGDIKMVAVMGLFLEWPMILPALCLAFFTGGLLSTVLLIFKRKTMKDPICFGPFLALGTIITVLR